MKKLTLPIALIACFVVYTALVLFVDVQPVGPEHSAVGFATINAAVHGAIGVHMLWDVITDGFAALSVLVALAFAAMGLMQLVQRKSLVQVDRQILLLGGVYVVTILLYALFEKLVINYRPVILDEGLEPSYPSSHTLVVLCILGTARIALRSYIKKPALLCALRAVLAVIMLAAVVGRLLSGVHWLTDIVGGALLSCVVISLYAALYGSCVDGSSRS